MPTITRQFDPTKVADMQPKRRVWILFAAQLIVFSILAIVLLEVLFRFWRVGAEIFLQPDNVLGCRHIPGKLVVWRCEGYSHDRFNNDGLRDYNYPLIKPYNTRRIAVLGDSTSEGLQVALSKTYPKILERMLNEQAKSLKYEVINFACSSYSTGQELLQYQSQVVKYDPDIIVLLYNMGDAQENALNKEAGSAEVRPYFAIDKNNKLILDNSVLKINKARLTPNEVSNFLSCHSRIYGALCQASFTQTLSDSRYRKFSNWIASLIWPRCKYASCTIGNDKSEVKVTKAIVRELESQAKARGTKFILLTYPCLSKQSQYFTECEQLSRLGEKEHFPVLNLTSAFLSYPNDISAKPLFYAYHLSPSGHQLVASCLDKLLADSKWIQ
jgi:hypothetical protein